MQPRSFVALSDNATMYVGSNDYTDPANPVYSVIASGDSYGRYSETGFCTCTIECQSPQIVHLQQPIICT